MNQFPKSAIKSITKHLIFQHAHLFALKAGKALIISNALSIKREFPLLGGV